MTKQEDIRIEPFKANRHRHMMPFKKGQGVSLAGWQFEVKSCQANGTLNLKCRGKIVEQSEFANVPEGGVPVQPTKNMAKIDTSREPLTVTFPVIDMENSSEIELTGGKEKHKGS